MKKYRLSIDQERCKGCSLCVKFCPQKKLLIGNKINKKGHKYVIENKNTCTGCGICYIMCPDLVMEIEESFQ